MSITFAPISVAMAMPSPVEEDTLVLRMFSPSGGQCLLYA